MASELPKATQQIVSRAETGTQSSGASGPRSLHQGGDGVGTGDNSLYPRAA